MAFDDLGSIRNYLVSWLQVVAGLPLGRGTDRRYRGTAELLRGCDADRCGIPSGFVDILSGAGRNLGRSYARLTAFLKVLACGVLLAPLTAQTATLERSDWFVRGEARDMESGELVYEEYHFLDAEQREHDVVYTGADLKVIVEKSIVYPDTFPQAPSFEQLDLREGALIGSKRGEEGVTLFYRPDPEAKLEEKTLAVDETVVIDAGFSRYIQDNWEGLKGTGTRKVKFAIAARQSLVDFELRAIRCDEGEARDQCFELKPSSWLIKMIAGVMVVRYNEQRELLSFKCMSNVADAEGQQQRVSISYFYPE